MRSLLLLLLFTLVYPSYCWTNNVQTIDSLQRILKNNQQQNKTSNISKNLLDIGKAYQASSQNEKALLYLNQAKETAESNQHTETLEQSLKLIAAVHLSMGSYEESYSYQLQRLQLSQNQQDSTNIAKSYYDIGSVFFYQEDFDKALTHYRRALDMAEGLKDSTILYISTAAIGSVYGEKKDSRLSSIYNLRSLEIAESIGYKVGIAYSARNVGQGYMVEKRYQKALNNFKKSLEIMQEMGNTSGESINLWSIGTAYSRLGEHESALENLEKALLLAKEVGDQSHLREIYEDIAEAYYNAGKLAEAYQYQKRYVLLKDSLVNNERIKQMSDLQHQNELQQTELEVLKKEQQLQDMLKIFLGITAIFLLLISILLYSRYHLQTKSNALLAEANAAIQDQNKRLEVTNNDLEKFAYIASHDLKEPLRMIGGYITLIERRYGENFNDNAKYFMGFIHEAIQRMYQLLDDLLIYSKLNIRENSYHTVNVEEMVSTILKDLQPKINTHQISINAKNLPKDVKANPDELNLVFHNLISNAIKFRNKDSSSSSSDMEGEPTTIDISCQPNGVSYLFSVKDNGIGIPKEYLEKVFVPFQRLHTRDCYEGNGIGLAICKKVVEQHKGKIWVESVENKGSTFCFSLPCT